MPRVHEYAKIDTMSVDKPVNHLVKAEDAQKGFHNSGIDWPVSGDKTMKAYGYIGLKSFSSFNVWDSIIKKDAVYKNFEAQPLELPRGLANKKHVDELIDNWLRTNQGYSEVTIHARLNSLFTDEAMKHFFMRLSNEGFYTVNLRGTAPGFTDQFLNNVPLNSFKKINGLGENK